MRIISLSPLGLLGLTAPSLLLLRRTTDAFVPITRTYTATTRITNPSRSGLQMSDEDQAEPPKTKAKAKSATATKIRLTEKTPAQAAQPQGVPIHEKPLPESSHKARPGIDTSSLGDLTGGRPGAIIESEEELARKQEIFDELERGDREYDARTMADYGTLQEDLETPYDIDDPTAMDAATLGTWTIRDLQSRFPYEWDPENPTDRDPNMVELEQAGARFKPGVDVGEDGIDVGYDPMFGQSNPQDERTILGTMESYMIDDKTKDESLLPDQFPPGDLEIDYNQDVVKFRRSLDIIETYTDEFLPATMQVPRHVAKWHGYPEPMSYPHKNETNNRFLEDTPNPTDWSKLDPWRARRKAVELARAQNADWLPPGKSQQWHASKRAPYEKIGTLVGTLRPGPIDESLREQIQPALDVLGSCVDLLSIEGEEQTVYRFHYYGLMKNRHGMSCWAETMIRDCGVEVTGVVFETGFRRRDQAYEGGDCWYPPSSN